MQKENPAVKAGFPIQSTPSLVMVFVLGVVLTVMRVMMTTALAVPAVTAAMTEAAIIHAGAVPAVDVEAERDIGDGAVDGDAVSGTGHCAGGAGGRKDCRGGRSRDQKFTHRFSPENGLAFCSLAGRGPASSLITPCSGKKFRDENHVLRFSFIHRRIRLPLVRHPNVNGHSYSEFVPALNHLTRWSDVMNINLSTGPSLRVDGGWWR
jgi:hypothetical protein